MTIRHISSNKKQDISNYIKLNDLTHYDNKLDCTCLLMTGNEHKDGQFKHFQNEIKKSSNKSKQHFLKTDFVCITKEDIDLDSDSLPFDDWICDQYKFE